MRFVHYAAMMLGAACTVCSAGNLAASDNMADVGSADWSFAVAAFDERLQPFRETALQRARDQALLDIDLSATPVVIRSDTPRTMTAVIVQAVEDSSVVHREALHAFGGAAETQWWQTSLPTLPAGSYRLQIEQTQPAAVLESPEFRLGSAAEWQVDLVGNALMKPIAWTGKKRPGLLRRAVAVLPWVESATVRSASDDTLPPTVVMLAEHCDAGRWDVLGDLLARADVHGLRGANASVLQCALRTGATKHAAQQLLAAQPTSQDQAALADVTLELAKLLLERGHPARSIALARRVSDDAAISARLRALELISRAHLMQGQARAADQMLNSGPHLNTDDAVLDQPAQDALLIAVLRINHAIARLQLGETEAGYALLDLVGRSASPHRDVRRLADHANVLLGWELLRQKQGRAASAALGRVSMRSPSTAMALLGQGWARLAPPGSRPALKTVALAAPDSNDTPDFMLAAKYRLGEITCEEYRALVSDDFVSCAQRRRLDADLRASDEQQQASQVLTPWALLTERALPGFASIEAAIAMGDVLGSRQATQQAQHYYQLALDAIAAHQVPADPKDGSQESQWLLQRWRQHGAALASQALLSEIESLREWQALPADYTALALLAQEIQSFRDGAARQTLAAAQARLNSYASDARFKLARLYDGQG